MRTDDGRFTVSESFAPSACALMPWCVLGDWAERGPTRPEEDGSEESDVPRTLGVLGASGFRGAHYYYFPARFAGVVSWCEACDCDAR